MPNSCHKNESEQVPGEEETWEQEEEDGGGVHGMTSVAGGNINCPKPSSCTGKEHPESSESSLPWFHHHQNEEPEKKAYEVQTRKAEKVYNYNEMVPTWR